MPNMQADPPKHIDVDKARGLTLTWADDVSSFYPVDYLRANSPSADVKTLKEEMQRNPLTVLPDSFASDAPLTITDAELVGNYALRLKFSDGHSTGIYSWVYLREIDRREK